MFTTATTKISLYNILPMIQQRSFFLSKHFQRDLLHWWSRFTFKSQKSHVGKPHAASLENIFLLTYFLITYTLQPKSWTVKLNTYRLCRLWSEFKFGSGCEFCKFFLFPYEKNSEAKNTHILNTPNYVR